MPTASVVARKVVRQSLNVQTVIAAGADRDKLVGTKSAGRADRTFKKDHAVPIRSPAPSDHHIAVAMDVLASVQNEAHEISMGPIADACRRLPAASGLITKRERVIARIRAEAATMLPALPPELRMTPMDRQDMWHQIRTLGSFVERGPGVDPTKTVPYWNSYLLKERLEKLEHWQKSWKTQCEENPLLPKAHVNIPLNRVRDLLVIAEARDAQRRQFEFELGLKAADAALIRAYQAYHALNRTVERSPITSNLELAAKTAWIMRKISHSYRGAKQHTPEIGYYVKPFVKSVLSAALGAAPIVLANSDRRAMKPKQAA